jgi:hypothetical protein
MTRNAAYAVKQVYRSRRTTEAVVTYAEAVRVWGCATLKFKSQEVMGYLKKLRFWKKGGNRKTRVVRGKSCLVVYIR